MRGGFEPGVGLYVGRGQGDGGGLVGDGVGREQVVVARVAHQLLVALLDGSRVRFQQVRYLKLHVNLRMEEVGSCSKVSKY